MAAELRWILLGLSVPLLAGIWWWTARRSRQAPGNPELRESTPPPEVPRLRPEARDWGVPPFEPLSIRTADFEHVPTLDGPILADPDDVPLACPEPDAGEAPAADGSPFVDLPSPPEPAPPAPIAMAPVAEAPSSDAAAELQRIVTIRVCAVGESRWSGAQLRVALELHGLAFGRYHVFHRKHADGRSLFCVASLIEPGTFDIAEMPVQEFRGITLFAVLPGALPPLETLDELFRTARGLAEELPGMLQDNKGIPLSPQRSTALREDIARFQAELSRA